jgi:hypothetical protein
MATVAVLLRCTTTGSFQSNLVELSKSIVAVIDTTAVSTGRLPDPPAVVKDNEAT